MFEKLLNLDFQPFFISFKLAFLTTVILFIIGVPFAWYLSQSKSKIKPILESITSLPLVLPPSVLGFYLLVFFSSNSFLGHFFEEYLGISLIFNFAGLVIASCIYSFPFMIQPIQSGFENLNKSMIEASFVSGKGKWETILKVALPNIKPSLLTAIVITFAHTVGEFGVVLLIGGSIEGQTKVASVAIYEFVEILDYQNAHIYSAIMLMLSFVVLLSVYVFNAKQRKKFL